jgi:hypothetical protein
MPKNLFTTQWSDGRLTRWNGSGWGVVGSFVPTGWSSKFEDRQSCGTFVHHGRLHTRRLTTASSPSSAKIGVFDGTDVSEIASVTWTGTND